MTIKKKQAERIRNTDFIISSIFSIINAIFMIYVIMRLFEILEATKDPIYGIIMILFVGAYRFFKIPWRISYYYEDMEE